MKPNEEIYKRLFEKFELIPEECYFIDDREENIKASKECGMNGYVFDMNNFSGLLEDLAENNINRR